MFRLARAHVARKPARARFRKQQLTSLPRPPLFLRPRHERRDERPREPLVTTGRRFRERYVAHVLNDALPATKSRSTARHLPRTARASLPFLPLTAPSVPRKFHSRCTLRRSSRAPVARGVHQRRRRLGRESRGPSGTSRPSPRPPSRTRSPRTLDRRRSRLASKISNVSRRSTEVRRFRVRCFPRSLRPRLPSHLRRRFPRDASAFVL